MSQTVRYLNDLFSPEGACGSLLSMLGPFPRFAEAQKLALRISGRCSRGCWVRCQRPAVPARQLQAGTRGLAPSRPQQRHATGPAVLTSPSSSPSPPPLLLLLLLFLFTSLFAFSILSYHTIFNEKYAYGFRTRPATTPLLPSPSSTPSIGSQYWRTFFSASFLVLLTCDPHRCPLFPPRLAEGVSGQDVRVPLAHHVLYEPLRPGLAPQYVPEKQGEAPQARRR